MYFVWMPPRSRQASDYLHFHLCFITHRIHVWDIPTYTIKINQMIQMWINIPVTWILWVIKLRSHVLLCAGNPASSNAGKNPGGNRAPLRVPRPLVASEWLLLAVTREHRKVNHCNHLDLFLYTEQAEKS